MFQAHAATEDSTTAVVGTVPWYVAEIEALPNELYQRFVDGTEGCTEMRELIFGPNAGVFASLRDPAAFADVSVDPKFGSVSWANGIDIAPDATYEDFTRYGKQILR